MLFGIFLAHFALTDKPYTAIAGIHDPDLSTASFRSPSSSFIASTTIRAAWHVSPAHQPLIGWVMASSF
jgi:hypothetical protein